MGTRIAGLQPGYLPWLGYFDQMLHVDAFLVADELPYSTAGWSRRNRVRGPTGAEWLTLPVRAEAGQPINRVGLDPRVPWARKHAATLRHLYARGVDVDEVVGAFENAMADAGDALAAAGVASLRLLAERFGIETPILISSDLGLEARYAERFPEQPGPTHRIIAYCEALGADELLEGASGRSYFDVPLFESHGLRVRFQDYAHPTWPQLHEPFLSHLSAIDLLLCVGSERAGLVLRSGDSRDVG